MREREPFYATSDNAEVMRLLGIVNRALDGEESAAVADVMVLHLSWLIGYLTFKTDRQTIEAIMQDLYAVAAKHGAVRLDKPPLN